MVSVVTRGFLVLSFVLSLMIAIGMRFFNEDLYVALVAGRDIVEGKLGLPDSWAFTTGGRVWMDTAPLSHLLFYLSYSGLAHLGPVLLQVALLFACAGIIYLRCRRVPASPQVSLFAVILGVLSIATFFQIRDADFGLFYFVLLTTLVADPRPARPLRLVAVVAVMVLWCNSHGTYVMGFGIVGLKILMRAGVGLRLLPDAGSSGQEATGFKEALRWCLTLAASLAAAALLNPYGPSYLIVPYIQLGSRTVTSLSADWLPLLHRQSLATISLFQPMDVRPFLVVATALILSILLWLVVALRRGVLRQTLGELLQASKTELLLELAVTLVLFLLSLRFRRTILFAGMAMVPLIAISIRSWILLSQSPAGDTRLAQSEFRGRILPVICSIGLFLFCALTFLMTTVPPYLPGNPTRANHPLVVQLMSVDPYPKGIVTFMRTNRIVGRVFAGWVISDYLLLELPGIQVFMDCRDQSAYPDQVLREYFSILHTKRSNPTAVRRALALLDKYRVTELVFFSNPIEFDLAATLMSTRRWACLYYDLEVLLLVRSDSSRFGPSLQKGRLPDLAYPDERTRTLSSAVLSYFMTGRITDELRIRLRAIAQETPHPNIFGLLYLSGRNAGGCMKPETRDYLLSQGKRLLAADPLTPGKGRNILLSVVRILSLLESDRRACYPTAEQVSLVPLIKRTRERLDALNKAYLGYWTP